MRRPQVSVRSPTQLRVKLKFVHVSGTWWWWHLKLVAVAPGCGTWWWCVYVGSRLPALTFRIRVLYATVERPRRFFQVGASRRRVHRHVVWVSRNDRELRGDVASSHRAQRVSDRRKAERVLDESAHCVISEEGRYRVEIGEAAHGLRRCE